VRLRLALCFFCTFGMLYPLAASACGELPPELARAVDQLAAIEATGNASPAHREAWRVLAEAPSSQLIDLLRAAEGSNPIAINWILSAADALASDTLACGDKLPIDELEMLLRDQEASSPGRRAAYEWIRKVEPERADQLLDSLRDDPNLDIRRDALAKLLATIKAIPSDNPERESLVREALRSARDIDQIRACKRELAEYGETLELAKHLGFVTAWRLIGPFDNAGGKGFDAEYPPEKEIDLAAGYEGKSGPVAWREELVTTDHDMGDVDIVSVVGPVKGAVVYLYAEVQSAEARPAQVRYASTNGTKLWVNGMLVGNHEVYHAGNQYDQYNHPVELEQGKNTLLLKVCQNEQNESWAQAWQFMLRITDELGGAIPLENLTAGR
jgi:hypothetical protein